MHVSKRVLKVPVSAVRSLTPYAKEAEEQGVKIYHLNIGDPDIETPEVLLNVLKNWKINPIRYAASNGEPTFLKALTDYYNGLNLQKIEPKNIIATIGGSEAIQMTMYTVADPGDEIIVFDPLYSNYSSFAAINSVKLVPILTSVENGFHLPAESVIEKKITKKTKAILYCSPNNPTGAIYTKDEIAMLVRIAKKHNLFLISDEVYREYVFTDQPATSLLEFFSKIPDRAIIVDSLSKRYSLCGARLGAVVSLNDELIKEISKLAQSRLSGELISQVLASDINKVPQSYFDKVKNEYQKRRDFLYQELLKIPGVKLQKPEGAFYTMVTLPVKNAQDFCIYLLKDFRLNGETLMLAPGSGFYGTKGQGLNEVRIAYVLNIDDLKKSLEILRVALEKYR